MRLSVTGGLAVLAAVSIALTGCSDADLKDAKQPVNDAAKVDLRTLLPQSLQKIERESFSFSATVSIDEMTVTTDGAFDMAEKTGEVSMNLEGRKMEMRVFGTDMYMSSVMEKGRWLHIDLDKLALGNTLSEAANPVANSEYLLAISDGVKKVGDNRYEGTLDMKKYMEKHADAAERRQLEKAFDTSNPDELKMPFEATLDDEGRLTAMDLTMTMNIEGEKLEMVQKAKYFDFGTEVVVKKPPAGKVDEAPAEVYKS